MNQLHFIVYIPRTNWGHEQCLHDWSHQGLTFLASKSDSIYTKQGQSMMYGRLMMNVFTLN